MKGLKSKGRRKSEPEEESRSSELLGVAHLSLLPTLSSLLTQEGERNTRRKTHSLDQDLQRSACIIVHHHPKDKYTSCTFTPKKGTLIIHD